MKPHNGCMPHNVISALKRNKVLIHSMTYINLKRITGEKKAKKKYTPYSTDKGKNKTEQALLKESLRIVRKLLRKWDLCTSCVSVSELLSC